MTKKPIVKISIDKIYDFKRMSEPDKYKHLTSKLKSKRWFGSNRYVLKSIFCTFVKLYKTKQ